MKISKFLLACIGLLSFQSTFAQKPHVTNVNHQSIGNKIRINYELVNASKNFRIWAYPILITNDSLTDDKVIKSAQGGIGLITSVDGPKIIEWEWYKDVAALPPTFQVDIRLKAQLKVPISHVISYSGNSLAPFGFKYSLLSRNGFYLSGKTLNFESQKVRGTTNELLNGSLKQSSPYRFNDSKLQTRFLTLGYSRSIKPYLHAYAGAGVGIDRTIWEVSVLDGNLLPGVDQFWVESTNNSTAGKTQWLYELGMNLLFKKIMFDVGVGLSDQEKVFLNFGVGVVLVRTSEFR